MKKMTHLETKLSETKDPDFTSGLPIVSAEGVLVGSLRVINESNANIASRLTEWRAKHADCFFSRFNLTTERTIRWLSDVVLPDRKRALFVIYDRLSIPIGSIGLRDIEPDFAELDSVLKQGSGEQPNIMYDACCSLLAWCYFVLGCKGVNLRTLASNDRAISLYQRLGFLETSRKKLWELNKGDELQYVATAQNGNPSYNECVEMHLTKEAFTDRVAPGFLAGVRFFLDRVESVAIQRANRDLNIKSKALLIDTVKSRYSFNFSWLGRPIIQYPQDMVAMQELIWNVKPDLIIETGIAHGGSLIFSASMLAMLDYCDAQQRGKILDPANPRRKVLGIDIDIRQHNRVAIEDHPMFPRIKMIEGSSIDPDVVGKVREEATRYERILVCLDSNHTHDHVLAELEAYAPFVTKGSYCVVFDTVIEDLPAEMFPDRPWGPGNNPKTAVHEFLKIHPEFEIDNEIPDKLLITVAPDGYLRRTN